MIALAGSKAIRIHSAKNSTRCSVSPLACASMVALAVSGARLFRRYSLRCKNRRQRQSYSTCGASSETSSGAKRQAGVAGFLVLCPRPDVEAQANPHETLPQPEEV